MQAILSLVGTLVAGLCAVLLLRGFFSTRTPLLLWSGLCFTGLALATFLRYVDLYLLPAPEMYTWRLALGAFSMLLLVYGLIFESD